MGLSATIQNAVVSAFIAMGDLAKPVTYKSLTGAMVRDLDAGTSVPVSSDFVVKLAVFVRFTEKEDDKDINTDTDSKFICPQAYLAIEPKAADIIVDSRGRTWEIVKNMSDPAQAAVILQVRTSR